MKTLGRRAFCAGAASLPALGAAQAPMPPAEGFPRQVTLMVAGPSGGRLDAAAMTMASGLLAHLPAGTALRRQAVGGLDGVTGANQFAVLSAPDGATALLVPGASTLAWLAGDSRVHFEPARWLPILARTETGFVLGAADRPALPRHGLVRVAGGGALSPNVAAMLAFDVLDMDVKPVPGLEDEASALAALHGGHVDAVLVRGADRLAAAMRRQGVAPWFTLGRMGAGGVLQRDALAPDVPTLTEFGAGLGRPVLAGARFDAWRCAAGAAELQYALVLPALTPASAVAIWRDAGAAALTPGLSSSFSVLYAAAAATLLRALCPTGAALLELRSWLSQRLGWQPG